MSREMISIYKEVLSGSRERFPRGVWAPDDMNAKPRYRACIRYHVLEVDECRRVDILHIDEEYLKSIKLRTAVGRLDPLFPSIYEMVNYCFPEFNILMWEMHTKPRNWWNNGNDISAVRWLFTQKLGMTQKEIETCTQKEYLLRENGFSSIIDKNYRSKDGISKIQSLFEQAFPTYNFNEGIFYNISIDSMVDSPTSMIDVYIHCMNTNTRIPRNFWRGDNDIIRERVKQCMRYAVDNIIQHDTLYELRSALSVEGLKDIQLYNAKKAFTSLFEMVDFCIPEYKFTPFDFATVIIRQETYEKEMALV